MTIDWQKSGKKKPLPPNPTFREIRTSMHLDQYTLEEKAKLPRHTMRNLEAGKPVSRDEAERAVAALSSFSSRTASPITYTLDNVKGIVFSQEGSDEQ